MRLIFFIILICPSILFAQECKYEENKIDEFTKKKAIRIKKARIFSKRSYSNRFIDISLSRTGEIKLLTLILTEVGGSRLSCFTKDDILYLKQTNDSIVKLNNLSIECGNYQSTPQGYYYILSFNLSEEIISILKSSPISKIRIGAFEGDIKEDMRDYFIVNIKCLD